MQTPQTNPSQETQNENPNHERRTGAPSKPGGERHGRAVETDRTQESKGPPPNVTGAGETSQPAGPTR